MQSRTVWVVLFSIASFLVYRSYRSTEIYFDTITQNRYASDYFVGPDTFRSSKPVLWIHAQGELNARDWQSFGSRSSRFLNQPYMFLTMKSILDHCNESFNVCLIDDAAFRHLLPKWEVQLDLLPSPIKERYRRFAMTMLLHQYGGLAVPHTFLCFGDLMPLYKSGVEKKGAFAVETTHRAVVESNGAFMGCTKDSALMKQYVDYQSGLIKSDFSGETDFLQQCSAWCVEHMTVLDGRIIAVKKECGGMLDWADLLTQNEIPCIEKAVGIYFDAEELVRRPKFAWFSRMSVQQILESKLALAAHFKRAANE